MLRFALFPMGLALVLTPLAGCYSPSETDCELPPVEPSIQGLHGPYALGSQDWITIRGEVPFTFESSDASVVRVEKVQRSDGRSSQATLSFVGVGKATLRLEDEVGIAEEIVEVRAYDEFVVLLSEIIPIPIGPLSDRILLAGQQHVLILYLDEHGESLDGHGLAELTLSPGLELCDDGLGSLEFHCLSIEDAGAHVLEVTVGGERLLFPFEAVLESDIVEIEVLQPDEEDLEPGTWVQIDVVGVTEDGTHVTGIHPHFITDGVPYFGYFAYQFDPDTSSRLLEIEVLEENKRAVFRGTPSDENTFGPFTCESAVSGSGAPIPALVMLLGLAFLIRRRSRKKTKPANVLSR